MSKIKKELTLAQWDTIVELMKVLNEEVQVGVSCALMENFATPPKEVNEFIINKTLEDIMTCLKRQARKEVEKDSETWKGIE